MNLQPLDNYVPLPDECDPRRGMHAKERGHFGEKSPPGGFKVGDYVALVYSDHDEDVFDNPQGIITRVDQSDDEYFGGRVTVAVEGSIEADRVLLIGRPLEK